LGVSSLAVESVAVSLTSVPEESGYTSCAFDEKEIRRQAVKNNVIVIKHG
jgi:hypothetical protein